MKVLRGVLRGANVVVLHTYRQMQHIYDKTLITPETVVCGVLPRVNIGTDNPVVIYDTTQEHLGIKPETSYPGSKCPSSHLYFNRIDFVNTVTFVPLKSSKHRHEGCTKAIFMVTPAVFYFSIRNSTTNKYGSCDGIRGARCKKNDSREPCCYFYYTTYKNTFSHAGR